MYIHAILCYNIAADTASALQSNTTVIVVAVLGWVFLVFIVIVIIAVYIHRKSRSGKFPVE